MLPQFLIFVIFGTPRIIHDFARYAKKCENLRQKIALRQNSLLVYLVFLMVHLMSLGWCLIFSSPAKLVDFVNIINFENAVHKALRPSISNVIWVLSSDTDTIFQLNQLFSNSEVVMLSSLAMPINSTLKFHLKGFMIFRCASIS